MINHINVLILFTAISFLIYGVSCLRSEHMHQEFQRFGLSRYRTLTGLLQLGGAIGLLAAPLSTTLGAVAAAGLFLLMMLGFVVRIKIRDSLILTLPALTYMLIAGYLAVTLFRTG